MRWPATFWFGDRQVRSNWCRWPIPTIPWPQLAKITSADASDHVQLVLTDRSSLTAGHDLGVVAVKSWRLADLGSKHALLLAGLGWGSMPKFMVSDDLKRGRLVRLAIDAWDNLQYRFHTVHRRDTPPGPAASWLMERLAMDH